MSSKENFGWKIIFAIVVFGVVKAHLHLIRLVILAVIGLLGIYLLNNLSRDWQRLMNSNSNGGGGGGGGGGNGGGNMLASLTRLMLGMLPRPGLGSLLTPFSAVTRLSKRSIDAADIPPDIRIPSKIREMSDGKEIRYHSTISEVIKNDPFGCARKFVCYLSATPASNLTDTQHNIINAIRYFGNVAVAQSNGDNIRAKEELLEAVKLGKKYNNERICHQTYASCRFSNAQLLRISNNLR